MSLSTSLDNKSSISSTANATSYATSAAFLSSMNTPERSIRSLLDQTPPWATKDVKEFYDHQPPFPNHVSDASSAASDAASSERECATNSATSSKHTSPRLGAPRQPIHAPPFIDPTLPSTTTTGFYHTATSQLTPNHLHAPPCSTLTSTLSSVVHTTVSQTTTLLLNHLPALLPIPTSSQRNPHDPTIPIAHTLLLTKTDSASTCSHYFIHPIPTAKTASGKPLFSWYKFHVHCVLASSAIGSTITFDTVGLHKLRKSPMEYQKLLHTLASCSNPSYTPHSTHAHVPHHVKIHGQFHIVPAKHGCCDVTGTVSMNVLKEMLTTDDVFFNEVDAVMAPARGHTHLDSIECGEAICKLFLGAITNTKKATQREDEVDEANQAAFITYIKDSPNLNRYESQLIRETRAFATMVEPVRLRTHLSETSAVHKFFDQVGSDGVHKGMARAVVDTSAIRVLAWLWLFSSHSRVKAHIQADGNLVRYFEEVENSHSSLGVVGKKFQSHVASNRVFCGWSVWAREKDGGYLLANVPLEEYHDADKVAVVRRKVDTKQFVEGFGRGLWILKPLSGGVCDITFIQQIDVMGRIPHKIVNYKLSYNLDVMKDMQSQYLRNGKEVDAELREVYPLPPYASNLSAEQTDIYERCVQLLSTADNTTIPGAPIVGKKGSPFIKVTLSTSTRTLRATTELDCDATTAMAWLADYTGRERTRLMLEEGDPLRLLVEEKSPHDKVVLRIRRFPAPFTQRLYVVRCIVAQQSMRNDPLTYCMACESVPKAYGNVDHAYNSPLVTGTYRSISQATLLDDSRCAFTYVTQLALNETCMPSFFWKQLIPSFVKRVMDLRGTFQRDDEVDKRERLKMVEVLKNQPQTYSSEEEAKFKEVLASVSAEHIAEDAFVDLHGPDNFVHMSLLVQQNESGVQRAIAEIDTSVEECACWEMGQVNRRHLTQFMKEGGVERRLTKVSDHEGLFHVVYELGVAGLKPREWVCSMMWKWMVDGSFAIVYTSVAHPDYPVTSKFVRAQTQTYWRGERLPPIAGVERTKITFYQKVQLGGIIPNRMLSGLAVQNLMFMSRLRKNFDKSWELDKVNNEAVVRTVLDAESSDCYTKEENEVISHGKAFLRVFENNPTLKKVPANSPTVRNDVAFNKNDPLVWGRSTTHVRAKKEQVLAFMWNTDARCRWSDTDLERSILEVVNGHCIVSYLCKKGLGKTPPRDAVSINVWVKRHDNTLMFVQYPHEHSTRPLPGRPTAALLLGLKRPSNTSRPNIRVRMPAAMKIKEVEPGLCKVTYVNQLDMSTPNILASARFARFTKLMSSFTLRRLNVTLRLQHYFQNHRTLEEYDAKDGYDLGMRLMFPGKKKKRYKEVGRIIEANTGLTELKKIYPWLGMFLVGIVRGQLHLNSPVSTRLACLSNLEAKRIGCNLGQALRQRKTADAGVYQWKMQNPAMVQLFGKYPFMESLLLKVAKEVLKTAPWGLVWRVATGAGLSILDMVSDINVIVIYMKIEKLRMYGYGMAIMVGSCILIQLFVVWAQNRKKPRDMMHDMLVVCTGLKPGYDAYRVASGREQEPHHVVDAKMELVIMKGVEMFAESIPGCILQCFAYMRLLSDGGSSSAALVSIFISALTTGFTSASISYDFDTDPDRRSKDPGFYGYIPDAGQKRTIMFVCMMLSSSLLLLMRSIGAACLLMVGTQYLAWYIQADIALFLVYKLAMKDFWHWIPAQGSMIVVVSLLTRIITKIISDYTASLQGRNAAELGGAYWTFNTFLGSLFSFSAMGLFLAKTPREEVEKITSIENAWVGMAVLNAAWLLTFGVMLRTMKREYRRTFFSLQTGRERTRRVFLENDFDEDRADIFKKNRMLWKDLHEVVKKWVKENWWLWKETQPDWFSETLIAQIPEDMIPEESLREMKEAKRTKGGGRASKVSNRTRTSFTEYLGDANKYEVRIGEVEEDEMEVSALGMHTEGRDSEEEEKNRRRSLGLVLAKKNKVGVSG